MSRTWGLTRRMACARPVFIAGALRAEEEARRIQGTWPRQRPGPNAPVFVIPSGLCRKVLGCRG
jgi:hypothetical protein